MLKSIKIGRKEYPLKKGDYIIGSGDNYSLHAGNGRRLTKKAVKELKLETLCKKEIYDDSYCKSFTIWFIE